MGNPQAGRNLAFGAATLVGVPVLGLIVAADLVTGEQLSLAPFYLLVVVAGCWYGGPAAGGLLSSLSAVALVAVGFLAGHPYTSTSMFLADVLGRMVAIAVAVLLATHLRAAYERERRSARLDSLTGIPNRAEFDAALDLELARLQRFARPFALVYIDCDNFKTVNDREGHATGDELLRIVAATIGKALRRTDFSARLAGDEFGVLLPETDASSAGIVVDQMRERLLASMRERQWPVTFSMGIAVFSQPVDSLADALARADELMYRVKKRGKNGMLIETDGRRQGELIAEFA